MSENTISSSSIDTLQEGLERASIAANHYDNINSLIEKEPVSIVFIGHVDAGKSTLGGHILYVTGQIDQRTLEKYERESRELNRESWYLSWALDTNQEERSKGITVECGKASFETTRRRFTILDAPGHKNYVPNMISGAAQADIAILVISARKGEFETGFERGGQTREHAMLAKTLGVKRIVVAINKMDDQTVQWSESRYNECVTKLSSFLRSCGFKEKDCDFLPLSGFTGDNLMVPVKSSTCNWYSGPPLLQLLDELPSWERKLDSPFMMPVAEKTKDMGTILSGKIESGVVFRGARLLLMPNRKEVEVTSIFFEGSGEIEVKSASSGDIIRIKVKGVEEEDVSVGFVLCDPERPISVITRFMAQLMIVEHKNIICPGYTAVMHAHTLVEEITILKLLWLLDPKTGEKKTQKPKFAKQGQTLIADIKCSGPVCLEPFETHQQLGRFNLRDEGKTIAIGRILKLAVSTPASMPTTPSDISSVDQ